MVDSIAAQATPLTWTEFFSGSVHDPHDPHDSHDLSRSRREKGNEMSDRWRKSRSVEFPKPTATILS
eukprot:7386914-Prymnesium_polylepis.1